jgi:hypothetical protein
MYPMAWEWREADEELRMLYNEACTADTVVGLEQDRETARVEPAFFLSHTTHKAFMDYLRDLQKEHIKFIPILLNPKWALGSRHMKRGLSMKQLKEMLLVYMTEAEACILEILAYSSP